MKGLILHNFYSIWGNIKLTLLIVFFIFLAIIFLGEPKFLPALMAAQMIVFVANVGPSLQEDESSKWNKFEVTLPVRRKTVIRAKYLSFLILMIAGVLTNAFTAIFSTIILRDVSLSDVLFGFTYGLALALCMIAFMYPLILKLGAGKSELIMFIAGGFTLGFFHLLTSFGLPLLGSSFQGKAPLSVGIFAMVTSIILLWLSYILSIRIHREKEF